MKKLTWILLSVSFVLFSACTEKGSATKYQDLMDAANAYLEAGDLGSAKIEFNNALRAKSDSAEALYGLALVLAAENRWHDVERYLSKALEYDPSHQDARVKLASSYLRSGKLAEAERHRDYLLEHFPTSLDAQLVAAAVSYRKGEKENARAYIDKVFAADASNVDATVLKANDFISEGDYQKAVDLVEQNRAKNMQSAELSIVKIRALSYLGRLEEAVPEYENLIQQYPKNLVFMDSLVRVLLQSRQPEKALQTLLSHAESNRDIETFRKAVSLEARLKGLDAAEKSVVDYIARYPDLPELQLVLVDLFIAAKMEDQAMSKLESIIAQNKQDSVALAAKNRVAALALKSRQLEKAKQLYSEVLESDKENLDASLGLANIKIIEGDEKGAVVGLRLALRQNPDNPRVNLALAKAHEKLGEFNLANQHYAQAVHTSQQGKAESVVYAQYLLSQGEYSKADSLLTPILEGHKDDADVVKLLANAKIAQQDWKTAESLAAYLDSRYQDAVGAEFIRGYSASAQKNYPSAISAYKKILKLSPESDEAVVLLVRNYLAAGDIAAAHDFLDQTIASRPENGKYFVLKGELYENKGENALAEQAYRSALSKSKGLVSAHSNLIKLLMKQKKYADVEDAIAQALAVYPGSKLYQFYQATLYSSTGKLEQSIQIYRNLLERYPDDELAANNLASMLTSKGGEQDIIEAERIAQRFKSSENPMFLDTLGWIYVKQGKPMEAIELVQKALQGLPDNQEVQYHLGVAYKLADINTEAKKWLTKSLEGNTADEAWRADAKAALSEL